jgi:organic radical activating enzyme
LNNFRLKTAKCRAFAAACERTHKVLEQVHLYFMEEFRLNIATKGTVFEEWSKILPKPNESIIIYGRSNLARRLIPEYISMGLKITAILDKDISLDGTDYQGIPIIHPDKFEDKCSVIVITTGFVFKYVVNYLQKNGFNKILPYYFYLFDKEIEVNADNIEDVQAAYFDKWILSRPIDNVLNSVDVPITMKCSLRCKDCANLMQYFKNPQHTDFTVMKHSLEKLFSVLDYIFEVRVLGGEPFVNPDICKYLDLLAKYSSKYTFLTLFTNGTIIPNQEILDRLNNSKVILKISEYKNPRQKVLDLVKICNKNKIAVQVDNILEWQDCSRLRCYNRTKEENEILLRTCLVHNCSSIVDGKLFFCPFAGNLYTLKAAPESYHEFVNLIDENASENVISEQINNLMRRKYLKACDFCGGRPAHGNGIPAALQTEKPLDYQSYMF